MDKKIIGIIALVGVGYIIYNEISKKQNGSGIYEKRFRLSDGRIVRESQLPQLGYRKTPSGWVDNSIFLDVANRLRQGSSWQSILQYLQYVNWSALVDSNGNRVDINEPFSTTPSDWGLDDFGNLAGVNSNFVVPQFMY